MLTVSYLRNNRDMTVAEHPPLKPEWHREPCLGCGDKVKRHRGSWVEVVGTTSGAWLMAMPTEAARGVSTNKDAFPAEALYLLGVSHHDCLELSLRRIRAGEVVFAAELCEITIEAITHEDLTPLHLPPGPTDCLFCDQIDWSPITKEHIWPEWLQTQLIKRGARFPQNGRGRETSAMGPKARACFNCNTRWMSVLETDTKPLLVDMWDHDRILTAGDQEILASWVTKMLILFDGSGVTPLIPRGFAHDLRVTRKPPSGTWIWASAYIGSKHNLMASMRPLRLVPRGGVRPDEPNGLCVTFTAHRVVFQVVVTFYRELYELTLMGNLEELLVPLWPVVGGDQRWAPGGIDAGGLDDLIERIDDSI